MARSVNYALFDAETGFLIESRSVPARMFPPDIPESQRIVVPADGKMPSSPVKVDRRKARQPITHVERMDDVLLGWRQPSIPEAHRIQIARHEAIDRLDRDYAERIGSIAGPLASLHAEKRRQAMAGGGPLVADEADRIAILAHAETEEARIAEIEAERRRIKATLKSAATEAQIEAVMTHHDQKERIA